MRGRDGDKNVLLMRFKGRIVCCCVCVCGVKGGESRRRGGVGKGGEGGGRGRTSARSASDIFCLLFLC